MYLWPRGTRTTAPGNRWRNRSVSWRLRSSHCPTAISSSEKFITQKRIWNYLQCCRQICRQYCCQYYPDDAFFHVPKPHGRQDLKQVSVIIEQMVPFIKCWVFNIKEKNLHLTWFASIAFALLWTTLPSPHPEKQQLHFGDCKSEVFLWCLPSKL